MRFLIIFIFLLSNSFAEEPVNIKNLVINKELKKYDDLRFLDLKNNEVNLNGEAGAGNATTGGLIGSRIKFTAIAANKYLVEGLLIGDGTVTTPFDSQ